MTGSNSSFAGYDRSVAISASDSVIWVAHFGMMPMKALRHALLTVVVLLMPGSFVPCRLQAEDDSPIARPSNTVLTRANEVLALVNSETKANAETPDSWPWSGQYYAGDGIGFNLQLAIAPKAGVVYWSQGCLGLYKVDYGSFREKDGYIRLDFEEPGIKKETGNEPGLHPVLIPIRWGDCRYLIPENEMIDFCNHINSGSQHVSRAARFLRHVDDGKKKSYGTPRVPSKYQPYLLKEPIEAEITWIGKTDILEKDDKWPPGRYQVTEVRLNRGREQGLLPGMGLYCAEFPDLRILEVSASSSRAEASQWLLEEEQGPKNGIAAQEPLVRLGLRYSTRSSPVDGHSDKE